MTGLTQVVGAVDSHQEHLVNGTLVGDLFTFLVIAAILVAFCVTTAKATTLSLNGMRRRGWSDLAVSWAMLGVFAALFIGGWLVLDIWWALKAVGRGADRVSAAAD